MELEHLLSGLSGIYGVDGICIVPDDVWEEVKLEESMVKAANGSMELENIGLDECDERTLRICILTRPWFDVPDDNSLRMVDGEGHVVGHSILLSMRDHYASMENVVFLSDDFVLYTDVPIVGEQRFVMSAMRYRGIDGWIPEELDCVLWFPCATSSDILFRHMGRDREDLATGILAMRF